MWSQSSTKHFSISNRNWGRIKMKGFHFRKAHVWKMWQWGLFWQKEQRCDIFEILYIYLNSPFFYLYCRSNCYTVPEQNCVDVQTPVQKQNCETIKNCQQVEQQKCETITVQKCNNCQQVSRQICEDVQTEKTVFVTSKQCDSIPQEVCNTVEM